MKIYGLLLKKKNLKYERKNCKNFIFFPKMMFWNDSNYVKNNIFKNIKTFYIIIVDDSLITWYYFTFKIKKKYGIILLTFYAIDRG